MADRSSKTEQPTERRLEKAREEGQFPSAREFVGALQFMVFLGLLGRSIHRELRRWLKKVRRARALSAIGRLAISSPPRVH